MYHAFNYTLKEGFAAHGRFGTIIIEIDSNDKVAIEHNIMYSIGFTAPEKRNTTY